MLPNSDKREGGQPSAEPGRLPRFNVVGDTPVPGEQSVFKSLAAPSVTFPAAASLDVDIEGTVDASMDPAEADTYSSGSRLLLRDAPMGRAARQEPSVSSDARVSLITELREISGQVNRMMSQVDRAIHRLGEHAGEPLRR